MTEQNHDPNSVTKDEFESVAGTLRFQCLQLRAALHEFGVAVGQVLIPVVNVIGRTPARFMTFVLSIVGVVALIGYLDRGVAGMFAAVLLAIGIYFLIRRINDQI